MNHKNKRVYTPLLILIVPIFIAIGCKPTSTTPEPRDIDLNSHSLIAGRPPDFVAKTFTFYLGSTTDHFELTADIRNTTTNCPMEVISGSGAILETVTTDGLRTMQFPGNVGIFRFNSQSVGEVPGFNIESVRIFPRSGVHLPSVPATMANNMPSLPLSLNDEVLLPFGGDAATYFLVAQGVAGKTVEVVLDGPGNVGGDVSSVRMSTDSFVIEDGPAEQVMLSTEGSFKRFSINPNKNTLFMTVRSQGGAGLARLSVNEVPPSGLVSLQARFLSPSPASEAEITQLTGAVNAASQRLYRATAGRVRINSLTIFTRINAGGNPLVGDIFITNVDPATGTVEIPTGGVGLELGPDFLLIGGVVARAVLKQKFGLAQERSNSDGSPLCHNSLMGNTEGTTLCWARNHNPTNDGNLVIEAPTSAWDRLAPPLGLTPPTKTPPQILRNVSSVTFPLQVSRVN